MNIIILGRTIITVILFWVMIPVACVTDTKNQIPEELLWQFEEGDPKAQFHLGTLYDRGHGIPQDYALAESGI